MAPQAELRALVPLSYPGFPSSHRAQNLQGPLPPPPQREPQASNLWSLNQVLCFQQCPALGPTRPKAAPA